MKVLVLGATGVFGSRLARRLAAYPDISLILSSRSKARANALCEELKAESGTQSVTSVAINLHREDVAAQLAGTHADIVVHTAGPFQGQDYTVAQAAISCGMHYVDIADGRAFVANFHELDGAAKQASVTAVSGASSVPGLSSAVIGDVCSPDARIGHVDIAISPGNRAPRGEAVMRAILSYCGEKIPDGTPANEAGHVGWGRLRRMGFEGVGKRWISDCDVPDLDVLRRTFPRIGTISFGAGLELSFMHLGLSALSKLRQYRLLPNLALFSAAFHRVADKLMPFGSDVGGMTVSINGQFSNGMQGTRTWSLLATEGDGPYVPVLPAVILVRQLVEGRRQTPGASACLNQFSLAEFQEAAKELRIVCDWKNEGEPLLQRALGSQFGKLGETVKDVHRAYPISCAQGKVDVEEGTNWAARLLRRMLGLPGPVKEAPITVSIRQEGEEEVWCRAIGQTRFVSRLSIQRQGVLRERIGPVTLFMSVEYQEPGGFSFLPNSVSLLGVPLPKIFCPRFTAGETERQGASRFAIRADLPFLGRLISYKGELRPVPDEQAEIPGSPVMIFDGVCNFCNAGVNFFLRHDVHKRIRFCAAQSKRGSALLQAHGFPTQDYETVLVVDGDRLHTKSRAVLMLCACLPYPWKALSWFMIVPAPIRDFIYGLVAQRRYRILGKRTTCRIPGQDEKERFLA